MKVARPKAPRRVCLGEMPRKAAHGQGVDSRQGGGDDVKWVHARGQLWQQPHSSLMCRNPHTCTLTGEVCGV